MKITGATKDQARMIAAAKTAHSNNSYIAAPDYWGHYHVYRLDVWEGFGNRCARGYSQTCNICKASYCPFIK